MRVFAVATDKLRRTVDGDGVLPDDEIAKGKYGNDFGKIGGCTLAKLHNSGFALVDVLPYDIPLGPLRQERIDLVKFSA